MDVNSNITNFLLKPSHFWHTNKILWIMYFKESVYFISVIYSRLIPINIEEESFISLFHKCHRLAFVFPQKDKISNKIYFDNNVLMNRNCKFKYNQCSYAQKFLIALNPVPTPNTVIASNDDQKTRNLFLPSGSIFHCSCSIFLFWNLWFDPN